MSSVLGQLQHTIEKSKVPVLYDYFLFVIFTIVIFFIIAINTC